jgi:uncharacterized protein
MSKKKKSLTLLVVLALVLASALALVVVGFKFKTNECSKKDQAICKTEVDGNKLKLKVAYSRSAQAQGLMWVTELKDGTGMIFVYDRPQYLSFWMKNTLIPLSIAFVESDGKISVIYDMYPQPNSPDNELSTYPSPTMVKYAIEVPLGWFAFRNIKRNSYVDLPEQLK